LLLRTRRQRARYTTGRGRMNFEHRPYLITAYGAANELLLSRGAAQPANLETLRRQDAGVFQVPVLIRYRGPQCWYAGMRGRAKLFIPPSLV
jgi:hypothetical protein